MLDFAAHSSDDLQAGSKKHHGLNQEDQIQTAYKVGLRLENAFRSFLLSQTRDLDLIYADLKSPKHLAQHKSSKAVEDLPGLGEWYCVECAKWFEGEHNLVQHQRGKNHKRRLVFSHHFA